jgi:hypothetical protein
MERIEARPAVQEGLDVPEPSKMKEMLADPEKLKKVVEEAQAMMVPAK